MQETKVRTCGIFYFAARPELEKELPCIDCPGRAELDQQMRWRFDSDGFKMMAMLPGWYCSKCQTRFISDEIAEELDDAVDEWLVNAGFRRRFE
jgi:hypothetical protein